MKCYLFALGVALVTTSVAAGTASASPITVYTGVDAGVAFGSALPNSNAAAASFNTGVAAMGQATTTINFETTPVGAIGVPISIGSGVTLGVGNTPNSSISNVQNVFGMFDTTSGGRNFFAFVTQFVGLGTTISATATFNFASPVDAFGAYFTGIGNDTTFTVGFSDGSARLLTVPGVGAGSGASFFGFTDPGASIASLTLTDTWLNTIGNNFGYFVGVDDVQISSVPEPTSMLLLSSGLAALAARRRRHSS